MHGLFAKIVDIYLHRVATPNDNGRIGGVEAVLIKCFIMMESLRMKLSSPPCLHLEFTRKISATLL